MGRLDGGELKPDALDGVRPKTAAAFLSGLPAWHTLVLVAALLVMYVPTFIDVSRTIWYRDDQPPGPVILALALWLFYRKRAQLIGAPLRPAPLAGALVLALGLAAYLVGRSLLINQFEVGSLIFVLGGLMLIQRGFAALRRVWFPLFFLLFVIPVPGIVAQALTLPLKSAVSWSVEHLLYAAGYPVARAGVTLSIAQYRLLVADACAGLNSLFVLEALGLFYLNLMNYSSPWRNLVMSLSVIPIAFVANVVRVSLLVLLTYHSGDEVAQGYMHKFAGMVLFTTALALILATDSLVGRWVPGDRRRPA